MADSAEGASVWSEAETNQERSQSRIVFFANPS